MILSITHFYANSEGDAWPDIIDTTMLDDDLRFFMEQAVPSGSIELPYDVMQNELPKASITHLPIMVDGILTVYDK
jgi:hypothetical protein